MTAAEITFDATGESNETLVHPDADRPALFVRRENDTYTVATVETGEPAEGPFANEYLRGTDLADLLDTLARRGYRLS